MTLLLIAAASYLLGSIPFGYLLVRIFRGEDVRQSGSGNIGATNVSRKSPALGILTLLLDAGKGAAAVLVSTRLLGGVEAVSACATMSLAALLAIVGHMFPIWLKFRGGKGVATGLGSFLMIAPKSVLLAAAVFVLVVLVFRYVSLASILAVGSFPIFVWALHQYAGSWLALAFMSMSSLLILARHHQNIRRLFAGTENRLGSKRGSTNAPPARAGNQ
jgi:acyl phosphate:glycerol-3-phosphate acyltransferase